MTALSELLNRHLPAGWTGAQVHSRAVELGHTLRRPEAYEYLRGSHPQWPADETLVALADALQIPLRELQESLTVSRVGEPFVLPHAASQLTEQQRQIVLAVVYRLLESQEATPDPQRGPRLRPVATTD